MFSEMWIEEVHEYDSKAHKRPANTWNSDQSYMEILYSWPKNTSSKITSFTVKRLTSSLGLVYRVSLGYQFIDLSQVTWATFLMSKNPPATILKPLKALSSGQRKNVSSGQWSAE